MSSHPQLIFGGASVGSSFTSLEAVTELLETLRNLGMHRVDTAGRYPPSNPGASETLLGQAGVKDGFTIDTKILTSGDGAGSLSPEAIAKSVETSYERLNMGNGQVNVLYCHRPDAATPLADQAAALNEQNNQGKFRQLGVSNFSTDLLAEFIDICDAEGYVKPTVYQGQYNLVCRDIEKTLFPFLRQHNIVFNAFSPLAGGFLNGALSSGTTAGTRFAANNLMGQFFKAQYDKAEMHAAISELDGILASWRVSKVEASLRWICHHSALGPGDGVVLGASTLAQLEQNVEAVGKGALPGEVVAAMEGIWNMVSGDTLL